MKTKKDKVENKSKTNGFLLFVVFLLIAIVMALAAIIIFDPFGKKTLNTPDTSAPIESTLQDPDKLGTDPASESTSNHITEPPATDPAPCLHTFDDWTETKKATCTDAGEKMRKCSKCGATENDSVAALGHKPVTDPAVAATCTKTGLTEGSHCSVCGTVLSKQNTVKRLEHTYDTTVAVKVTCTSDGQERHTCRVCGTNYLTNVKHTGHEYTETVKEPTCTEDGYTTNKCIKCGDSYITGSRSALGHNEINGVCTRCGHSSYIDLSTRLSFPGTDTETSFTSNFDGHYVFMWNLRWKFKNISGRRIKYIRYKINFYNKVDDLLYTSSMKMTGPLEVNEYHTSVYECEYDWKLSYHNVDKKSVGKIVLTEVEIEYFDGTIEKGSYNCEATRTYS